IDVAFEGVIAHLRWTQGLGSSHEVERRGQLPLSQFQPCERFIDRATVEVAGFEQIGGRLRVAVGDWSMPLQRRRFEVEPMDEEVLVEGIGQVCGVEQLRRPVVEIVLSGKAKSVAVFDACGIEVFGRLRREGDAPLEYLSFDWPAEFRGGRRLTKRA